MIGHTNKQTNKQNRDYCLYVSIHIPQRVKIVFMCVLSNLYIHIEIIEIHTYRDYRDTYLTIRKVTFSLVRNGGNGNIGQVA